MYTNCRLNSCLATTIQVMLPFQVRKPDRIVELDSFHRLIRLFEANILYFQNTYDLSQSIMNYLIYCVSSMRPNIYLIVLDPFG